MPKLFGHELIALAGLGLLKRGMQRGPNLLKDRMLAFARDERGLRMKIPLRESGQRIDQVAYSGALSGRNQMALAAARERALITEARTKFFLQL